MKVSKRIITVLLFVSVGINVFLIYSLLYVLAGDTPGASGSNEKAAHVDESAETIIDTQASTSRAFAKEEIEKSLK